jgi:hypothetical protein
MQGLSFIFVNYNNYKNNLVTIQNQTCLAPEWSILTGPGILIPDHLKTKDICLMALA